MRENFVGIGFGIWVAAALASGCVAKSGEEPIDARGAYQVQGTWDLGGPLAHGRTPGDVAADILVDQIVSAAGVPGILYDEASTLVANVIAEDVSAAIDAALPPELQAGSPLRESLSTVLGEVDVESGLFLEDAFLPGSLKGTETVVAITVQHDGLAYGILPAEIAEAGALQAEWSAKKVGGAALDVEPHEVTIEYGKLVLWAAIDVLGEDAVDSYGAEVAALVDCAEITTIVLDGGSGFVFSVDSVQYELTAPELEARCEAMKTEVGNRALGMFNRGLATLGGRVQLEDANGDGLADSIASAPRFEGPLLLPPIPEAIAPRVTAIFQGVRE